MKFTRNNFLLMKRTALLLCLWVYLLSLTGAPGLGQAANANALQETGVYPEDFNSPQYKDTIANTVWDRATGLRLERRDAVSQSEPASAIDHNGETFVVWTDNRNGHADIYAQKLDRSGNRLWANDRQVNGDTGKTNQSTPTIALDRNGLAFIAWRDNRNDNGDIYAQKLSANGSRLWVNDQRVNRDSGTSGQYAPAVGVDGNGEPWVVWDDERNGNGLHSIYAQKLGLDGLPSWANDVQVNESGLAASLYDPNIALDSNGQAWVTWYDYRNGDGDIYAQKLGAGGDRVWVNDKRVNNDSQHASQEFPTIAVDSYGQAVITWQDNRDGNRDIYAQKLNAGGAPLWVNDVRVNTDGGTIWQQTPSVIVDANDQIWIAWVDSRNGNSGIYTQKLGAGGNHLWNNDANVNQAINSAALHLAISSDPNGQVFIAWGSNRDLNLYAQRVDPNGSRSWVNDVRVNEDGGSASQNFPKIAVDQNGQAFTVWEDKRSGLGIYAQKLNTNGSRLWNTDVRVDNENGAIYHCNPAIALDSGGAMWITWQENYVRFCLNPFTGGDGQHPPAAITASAALNDTNIYIQRLDANGNHQWTNDKQVSSGIVCNYNCRPVIAVNGNGQAMIVWAEYRDTIWDIYAQKLNIDGDHLWIDNVLINTTTGSEPPSPVIAFDKTGYTLIAWSEKRGEDQNIYVQKLDADGKRVWVDDIKISSGSTEASPTIAVDQYGQAVIAWRDSYNHVYAQKLNTNGELLWPSDKQVNASSPSGAPVIAIDGDDQARIAWNGYVQKLDKDGNRLWANDLQINAAAYDPSITTQSNGQAFIAWVDNRNRNSDIYAQLIQPDGIKAWTNDLQVIQPDRFYYPSGSAQSININTLNETIRKATLTANLQANSGTIQFYLSNTGGAQWDAVTPGVSHVFTTTGSDLRWKVELNADPAQLQRSPTIRSLLIEYSNQASSADNYEPDDTCTSARPIGLNGAGQAHNFHQAGDIDWVWLDVIAGKTYILQTSQTEANADVVFELRKTCPEAPLPGGDYDLGNDARITWKSIYTGRVYAGVSNQTPGGNGTQTGYTLSARLASPAPIAVIVGGHNDSYSLQSNIDYAADMAYRTFLNNGVPASNIKYFGLSSQANAGQPTSDAIRATIQDWARERGVTQGVPFFLYMVDHGDNDQFLANGSADKISAADLNLWLNNLEATTGADNINVIIDACKSGSFIDSTILAPAKISSRNRVVITSTSSSLNAYGSRKNDIIYFSNAFWTALGQNMDLLTAFQYAKQAVESNGLDQVPWLDDNGDALADDRDGAVARERGLAASLGGSPPVVDWVLAGKIVNGQAVLQAQVRDDANLEQVWVEIYPPDFVEPPPTSDGITPELNRPILALPHSGGDLFAASYAGFSQTGIYRLVFYAQDVEGNLALPVTQQLISGNPRVFLPVLQR